MKMDTKAIEQYKFYRLYEHDFDNAIHTLKILKRYKKLDVRHALLRDIIVTYAKPFSVSHGIEITKHKLSTKLVPSHSKALHEELFNVRNQLFAHTDLLYKNPKVTKWDLGKYKRFPMSFKGYDYTQLNRQVDEITNLAYAVQKGLRRKIREIEKDL
ncbi:MAG TPA: hypothetical protein DD713_03080 [Nitrospiraceae bacterium]|nr:hypothetical protein [Nitrospiraceae bacterium]